MYVCLIHTLWGIYTILYVILIRVRGAGAGKRVPALQPPAVAAIQDYNLLEAYLALYVYIYMCIATRDVSLLSRCKREFAVLYVTS